MSSLVNYLHSWWVTPDTSENSGVTDNESNDVIPPVAPELSETPSNIPNEIVFLVSTKELLSVKLKPVKNVIPAPARNMPCINKFELHKLNQAQLKEILNVKLKHVKQREKTKKYEPRHPVLKELLERRPVIY